jgi:hypothetical protein
MPLCTSTKAHAVCYRTNCYETLSLATVKRPLAGQMDTTQRLLPLGSRYIWPRTARRFGEDVHFFWPYD